MSNNPSTPQEDAERIRLKRLEKLQAAGTSGRSSPTPSTSATQTVQPTPVVVKPAPAPSTSARPTPPPAIPSPPVVKKKVPVKLNLDTWEHEIVGFIFNATIETYPVNPRLNVDLADRILIARLELDPSSMSDDLEYLPVIASLPPQQTTFEYLVGAWKRVNATKSALTKSKEINQATQGYSPSDTQTALLRLEKLRELLVSYIGLTLQEPEMFPQPQGRPLGPLELVTPLLSLSALSGPLFSAPTSSPNALTASDIEQFLQDLARRFEPDNEIDDILGPVVRELVFHESLFRPEGLGGGDASWRGVVGGLELLVSIKPIAMMITRLEEWNPSDTTAADFEKLSLFGPLCRLGVFAREWPSLGLSYFSDPEKRSRDDIESSFASLRGTLKSLQLKLQQSSLFQIFNTLVRAGPESREAVLQYFARVISLNSRRAGTHMDRIDPLFYARSPRIDLREETRIKATSDEAAEWERAHKEPNAPEPNFISNIFYLTIALSHYGYLKTIQTANSLAKHLEDLKRHLDYINGDGSWIGGPMQARIEAAINQVKNEQNKIRIQQLAFQAQLSDPEFAFRALGFTIFLSTWMIRQVDPKKAHPTPVAQIPLPGEVPLSFRVLPEYIVEDIVDYFLFVVQTSPEKFEMSGKTELMTFILTFLNSTWYIKNPFLKAKINDVLFMSILGYGYERQGILGNLLNTHPLALKHLMPALMHFYIGKP
ncbi:hypothetical protein H0H93_012764 [Arthromyces matolae]|nr:hypothetical protein H0H93_012764 [Arthromyces matolae]